MQRRRLLRATIDAQHYYGKWVGIGMKSKRRWLVLVSISPLLTLVVAATIQIGIRIRQDNLDQALIHAVRLWDAPEVTALLKQGARANAR